jgi:hypothetical protein
MITHIIKVLDFVKLIQSDVKDKYSKLNPNDGEGMLNWDSWGFERICNYNDFISLVPKLYMFVACDEQNNLLEKPFEYDKWKEYDEQGWELLFDNDAECLIYKQAEDRILFKNYSFVNNKVLSFNRHGNEELVYNMLNYINLEEMFNNTYPEYMELTQTSLNQIF